MLSALASVLSTGDTQLNLNHLSQTKQNEKTTLRIGEHICKESAKGSQKQFHASAPGSFSSGDGKYD